MENFIDLYSIIGTDYWTKKSQIHKYFDIELLSIQIEMGVLLLQYYDCTLDKCDNDEIRKTFKFIVENQVLFINPLKFVLKNDVSNLDIFNVLDIIGNFAKETVIQLEDDIFELFKEKAWFLGFKLEVASLLKKFDSKYNVEIRKNLTRHKEKLQKEIDSIDDFLIKI
ncbi:MAG TPA: hypothetical protein VIR55_05440 [Ignavibacteria bacterium]